MYRGTTPNIVIKVNSDLDLSAMEQIWVTFKNKSAEKNYDKEVIEVDAVNNTLSLTMSQEDTLAFQTCGSMQGKVEVQLRLLDDEGMAYASKHGMKVEHFPADWGKFGNAAGPIRNKQMAERADAVIVFWDGTSPGTADMIQCAKMANKPVTIIKI